MKKTINEEGVVFGLMTPFAQGALKYNSENGGNCFIYSEGNWGFISEPRWQSSCVYKVEYTEKEVIPWDEDDFFDYFMSQGVLMCGKDYVRISLFSKGMSHFACLNGTWKTLKELLKKSTKPDGSKFEKEKK